MSDTRIISRPPKAESVRIIVIFCPAIKGNSAAAVRNEAVGTPYSDSMEAVGNPVIGGDGSKSGIHGIGCSVNGNIYREGIGGGI